MTNIANPICPALSATVPVLRIDGAVDPSTGNVQAPGDVEIAANVVDLYTVKAGGNITVKGLIEAAHIEAGGDLKAAGISGKGTGHCRAGGNVFTHYVANAVVHAKGDLHAETEITSSTIVCGGTLRIVGGPLLGGNASAVGGLQCAGLGSSSAVNTVVEIGVDPKLRADAVNFVAQIERNNKKAAQILQSVALLMENVKQLNATQKESVMEMQFNACLLQTTAQDLLLNLITGFKRVMSAAKLEIEVSGNIYPGVTLRFPGLEAITTFLIEGPVRIIVTGSGRDRAIAVLKPDSEWPVPFPTRVIPNVYDQLRALAPELP